MTPQEQYPKFYSHPNRFVGELMVRDSKSIWYEIDTKFDSYLCAKCFDYMDIQDFEPLFKPQEGEAFIKDLEVAVSAGFVSDDTDFKRLMYGGYDESDYYYFTSLLGSVYVNKSNIGICKAMDEWGYSIEFDTSAYVDKMRGLGYYV